jgi:hypothetical protein
MRILNRNRIAAAVLAAGLSLGGCASSSSSLMDARAEAPTPAQAQTQAQAQAQAQAQPQPQTKRGTYLPVEDVPARRGPSISVDEQAKLKQQLINARDRQSATVKARDKADEARDGAPQQKAP